MLKQVMFGKFYLRESYNGDIENGDIIQVGLQELLNAPCDGLRHVLVLFRVWIIQLIIPMLIGDPEFTIDLSRFVNWFEIDFIPLLSLFLLSGKDFLCEKISRHASQSKSLHLVYIHLVYILSI